MATDHEENDHEPPIEVLLAISLAVASLGGLAITPSLADGPISGYADLVEKVSPAVVFIQVTGHTPGQASM